MVKKRSAEPAPNVSAASLVQIAGAEQVPIWGTTVMPVPKTGNATSPAPEIRLPYILGQWSGLPQYKCRQCPFDSLDEIAILEHIAGHMVAEQPPTLVQAFDARGNPI